MYVEASNDYSPSKKGEKFFAYLDSPRAGNLKGKIRVRGWVLPDDCKLADIQVVVFSNGQEIANIGLNKPRTTVIQKILKQSSEGHPLLHCEFDTTIEAPHGPFSIYIKKHGIDLGIWDFNISLISKNENIDPCKKIWDAFCNNAHTDTCIEKEAGKIAEQIEYTFIHRKELDSVSNLSLCSFLDDIGFHDFGMRAVRSLGSFKTFFVKSPDSEGTLSPTHSFWANRCHAVRMEDSQGNIVFILQLHTSCDAIFLPKRNIFIRIRYVNTYEIDAFIGFVISNYHALCRYFKRKTQFAGFIASNSRPSHFFSNISPAIACIREKMICQDLVYIAGGDFVSLGKVLNLSGTERTVTADELNEGLFEGDKFFFLAGIPFSSLQKTAVNVFDSKYVAFCISASKDTTRTLSLHSDITSQSYGLE